LLQALFKQVT
jgi:hypothetical protein